MKHRFAVAVAPFVLLMSGAALAAPSRSRAAAEGALPASVETFGAADLNAVRATRTFQQFFPTFVKSERDIGDGIVKVKKVCGIDPVTAVSDVAIGVDRTDDGAFFVALTGVTEAKFVECLSKLAKTEKETLTIKKTGAITEVKSDKGSSTLFFAWLPGDVVAMATEPEERALLERMLAGKGALAKTALGRRLGSLPPDGTFNVASVKAVPVDGNLTVKSFAFSLKTSSGDVFGDLLAELGSPAEASQVVSAVKAVASSAPLPSGAPREAREILKSLTADAKGAEAHVTAKASETDLVAVGTWAVQTFVGGLFSHP